MNDKFATAFGAAYSKRNRSAAPASAEASGPVEPLPPIKNPKSIAQAIRSKRLEMVSQPNPPVELDELTELEPEPVLNEPKPDRKAILDRIMRK